MHPGPLILIAILPLLNACGGPLLGFPGGALAGAEQNLSAAPPFTEDLVIQLETRPEDPYSVNINAFVIDGSLHIDPAPGRTWGEHLARNPMVRVGTGGSAVFLARAERVTDAAVLERFDADRVVYRLLPR